MSKFTPRTLGAIQQKFDGGLSPITLVEECLGRIEDGNDACNAMIFVGREQALDAARLAETELRAGRRRGQLHGIPIALKDVIDVEGWATTGGSRLFDGEVAVRDATCVANLRAAGAIIIGKTNLHELTAGGHANPWFGKVINPLDPSRGTGGTSSGSAAAVAAGYCVAAIGTDTGGSNRSPAAATGLVGFKPTNGLVSAVGVLPTARTFDTIGPLAVDVEDARLIHYALLGKEAPPIARTSVSGLSIGLCEDLYSAEIDPAVAAAHDRWLQQLTGEGAIIRSFSFPLAEEVRDAGRVILFHEMAWHYSDLIARDPERVGKPVRDFVAEGLAIDEAAYAKALKFRDHACAQFFEAIAGLDVLAVPVSPGLAPRLDDEMTQVGPTAVPYGAAGAGFRRWANFFGMPAIAIPLPTGGGLPASIQLATVPTTEATLFSIASALQSGR